MQGGGGRRLVTSRLRFGAYRAEMLRMDQRTDDYVLVMFRDF